MEGDSLHRAFRGDLPGEDGSVLWYSMPAYRIHVVVLKHGDLLLQPGKGHSLLEVILAQ